MVIAPKNKKIIVNQLSKVQKKSLSGKSYLKLNYIFWAIFTPINKEQNKIKTMSIKNRRLFYKYNDDDNQIIIQEFIRRASDNPSK